MQFVKTIDLWADKGINQDRILSGELKIQTGQWVQCGPGKKSRFIKATASGSLWIIHAEGHPHENPKITRERFSSCCSAWRR